MLKPQNLYMHNVIEWYRNAIQRMDAYQCPQQHVRMDRGVERRGVEQRGGGTAGGGTAGVERWEVERRGVERRGVEWRVDPRVDLRGRSCQEEQDLWQKR